MTRPAEKLRVGKRQVRAGEVGVKKRVETEQVRETVKLRSEDVDVQRRPITDSAAHPDVEISADEIRVPIYEEEAVVEKRPVLKEEVIISKRPTEKTETIEADVRKERIDVDEHADVRSKPRPIAHASGRQSMADIDVVPKPKSNVWLWYILAAIVVAVILFMLLGGRSDASRAVGELLDTPAFVVVLSSIA